MKRIGLFIVCAASWLAIPSAQSDVIMLDFGTTTVGTNSHVNSPYHTVNGAFANTNWNKVQTADIAAGGVRWSDGTTAAGVSLNLGGSSDATTLNLATVPTTSALGNQVNTGVYTNTSVGRDGIFVGGSGSDSRQVGFQLSGLGAGLYEVYLTGRNTSTASSNTPSFRVGTTDVAGNFTFTGYDVQTLRYSAGIDSSTAAWAEAGAGIGVNGENYVKFTVALNEGDYLNVVVSGSFGESRGFLNAAQIVLIPEPSALLLIGCGLGMLALFRRKHRRI